MKRSHRNILAAVMTAVTMGVLFFTGAPAPAQGTGSGLFINLSFTKNYFASGEPIGAKVSVTNITKNQIYISKGFNARNFCLEMRLINPAGQLVMPVKPPPPLERPDAPPLPFVISPDRSKVIEEVSVEELSPTWQKVCNLGNLRPYYDLSMPGQYSAQVRVSALTCYGLPCDVNNPRWRGVVTSQTRYFFVEGDAEVRITPSVWELAWRKVAIPKHVTVTIWPEKGKSLSDYNWRTIRLNNLHALEIKKTQDPSRKKDCLVALFDSQKALQSLGTVEANKEYPVLITGKDRNGGWFGGASRVKLVLMAPPIRK